MRTLVEEVRSKGFVNTRKEILLDVGEAVPDVEAWTALGNPIMWQSMETLNGYEVQGDFGYGYFRLLKDGVELDRGKKSITSQLAVVVLDKDYYGVAKYLWF